LIINKIAVYRAALQVFAAKDMPQDNNLGQQNLEAATALLRDLDRQD
jgi:hypothetical protein